MFVYVLRRQRSGHTDRQRESKSERERKREIERTREAEKRTELENERQRQRHRQRETERQSVINAFLAMTSHVRLPAGSSKCDRYIHYKRRAPNQKHASVVQNILVVLHILHLNIIALIVLY